VAASQLRQTTTCSSINTQTYVEGQTDRQTKDVGYSDSVG